LSSSEDVFKDGLIDLEQLNYILRNPELPKSRVKINSILKQYNQEKCRAISLARINYKSRNQLNLNPINHNSLNNTTLSDHNPIDFDHLAEYEVKLSQLPQELLVSILGETFTKYQIQINQRNNLNLDQNQNPSDSHLCVKQEIISDIESDCEPNVCDVNIKVNELTQQLKKLISDYESVEKEENSVSEDLQNLTKQLENKLSALRECIALCEALKEQNLSLSQKQTQLKDKKSELKHEINKIKDKLIRLSDSYSGSIADDEYMSEPVVRIDSTANQTNDRKTNSLNIAISTKTEKTSNLSETNQKKRKVPKIVTNSRQENRSKTDIQMNDPKKSDSVEGTNGKLRKLSIGINSEETEDLNSRSKKRNLTRCETYEQITIETDSDDVMIIDESDNASENSFQSDGIQTKSNDWRSNYVNLVINPASVQSQY